MSPTGWVLIFTISCVMALKNIPRRAALKSAALNYGDLRAFKHHGDQSDRTMPRQWDDFDQLNNEELFDDLGRENGQEETIGDGFQNVHDSLGSAYQAYLEHLAQRYQTQDDGASSNFRERERSRTHNYMNDQGDDIMKELVEEMLEEEAENENYGIPREIPEDPQYEYQLSMGDGMKSKLYNGRAREDNWNDYYNPEPENYRPLSSVERRNVNARYPLGRDLRFYKDMAKRFPVAKRSPKSMTKKRQVTDPKVAQDLASLFSSQPTEKQNEVHQTTVGEQNHTFNHEDHTTVVPLSTVSSKNSKEKEPTQSLKSKEHVIDVQKKSIDWTKYFGYDRRKKKAVLAPRPGSQNQDDAFFLQHYYSTMGDNLQSAKRNSEKDLEEKIYRLQQIDSRLKNIKDLAFQEAVLEGSQNMDLTEEAKENILNKLATAYSMQKMRKALKDFRNSIIMQQQENQFANNYDDRSDYEKSGDKHPGREVAEGIQH